MGYKIVMRQDYDKRIRFHKNPLFCYSKKKFEKLRKAQEIRVVGEILDQPGEECADPVEIGAQRFEVFAPKSKSRLIYGEAGYLSLEDGSCLAVLKNRIPFLLLLAAAAAALIGIIWFALFRTPAVPVVAPPAADSKVEKLEEEDTEKMQSEEGGGAVRLTYSLDARLSLDTGEISMYFLNPSASNHDLAITLYLLDGENAIEIARSGMIQAGYGLTRMQLIEDSAILSEGTYPAFYAVSFFHPQTGEKALVESTVTDVELEVRQSF